jgi:hypothetical protein
MYDFIGDIHGHADKLTELLENLGYSSRLGIYSHPTRKVFFIGDYIDRGPKIRETLTIVRKMVESDNAIALLGNHEYNALCYHYKDINGEYLREHSEKNFRQHANTLQQFENCKEEYKDFLGWFETLPIYYETEDFRAVHACWDNDHIVFLQKEFNTNSLNTESIHLSVRKGTDFYRIIDETLKGKEALLPDGRTYSDLGGAVRNEIRIKWWQDPTKSTFSGMSVMPLKNLPEGPFDVSKLHSTNYYSETEKPVFFGHYWYEGHPELLMKNVCCLDYSIANNGRLVAYSYDGEKELLNEKFSFV